MRRVTAPEHQLQTRTKTWSTKQTSHTVWYPIRPKADDALKILIRNATEEFGFAPRGVYNGVLNPSDTKEEHVNAREGLDWSRLQTLVQTFSRTRELSGLSHHVVAVYPCISGPKLDRWAITFKSVRIEREVMKH